MYVSECVIVKGSTVGYEGEDAAEDGRYVSSHQTTTGDKNRMNEYRCVVERTRILISGLCNACMHGMRDPCIIIMHSRVLCVRTLCIQHVLCAVSVI